MVESRLEKIERLKRSILAKIGFALAMFVVYVGLIAYYKPTIGIAYFVLTTTFVLLIFIPLFFAVQESEEVKVLLCRNRK